MWNGEKRLMIVFFVALNLVTNYSADGVIGTQMWCVSFTS